MNFKSVWMVLTVAAMAAFGTGCGDVCEDAADVCGADDSADDADGDEAECDGPAEEYAQCIVDEDKCDADTQLKCLAEAGQ